MKQIIRTLLITLLGLVLMPIFTPSQALAASCHPAKQFFLGLPTWYEYLPGDDSSGTCVVKFTEDVNGSIKQGVTITNTDKTTTTNYDKSGVAAIWLIGLAIIDILLRLSGLIAVGIVIFGGFKYITSQGNPDATKSARRTIINAFVGIAITIVAAVSVNFIAKLLQKP